MQTHFIKKIVFSDSGDLVSGMFGRNFDAVCIRLGGVFTLWMKLFVAISPGRYYAV